MRPSVLFPIALLLVTALPAGASPEPAPIEPAVLKASGPTSAFVHAVPGRLDAASRAAEAAGLDAAQHYDQIDVFVALGRPAGFRALALSPAVSWIEANAELELYTDSSHIATRSEDLYRGKGVSSALDGSGVGVAVVDTGVDGTIPALQDPVGRGDNFKIVCPVPGAAIRLATTSFQGCPTQTVSVPMEDTDTIALGGHGTHVAGIIAGSETEVIPTDTTRPPMTVHGAAPGAAIYGIGAGAALSVDNAMDGLQWVLDNHDQVSPQIRVVNNSWGTAYEEYTDPDDESQPSMFVEDGYRLHRALWKMQDALVEDGITVVFAAGNSGGGLGAAPTTTAQCINPTPGVICVANYNDLGSGSRDGEIDGTSSRGERSRPETWPDISAPGTGIVSTCRPTLPLCSVGSQVNDEYFALSGTSMAAPHIAGIVAQLWGDWCNFDADTAVGHSAPQSYFATTRTEWSVDDDGIVRQEVTQVGFMTTEGVRRPFRSTLTTSGPASAYLTPAPLRSGDDFLAPRFFDESLDVEYEWTVPGYYSFEYHNVAGDGAEATYGPTFCR